MNLENRIEHDMSVLENSLKEVLSSKIVLATEVANYLVNSGGKRIRPMLTLLIGRALDYQDEKLIKLACAIELLHTATLMHDDVVDQSDIRRGKTSIQKKWDNAHGVLVGDFVYSKAFQLMAELGESNVISVLADSTNKISEGEVLQLSLKGNYLITEKEYLEIIERKTAELFQASAYSAALLAKAKETQTIAVKKFAFSLGIAFQIQDDLLDYMGNQQSTGKKIGKDLSEGKLTLPLIKVLEMCNKKESEFIKLVISEKKSDNFEKIKKMIESTGALDEVKKLVSKHSSICLNQLNQLPRSPYRQELENLVNNLKQREF